MSIYSYIVASDSGFAPNPFAGYCTLACCKPAIRRTAEPGGIIVGLTPKSDGNRILYIMHVDEKVTYAEYWHDDRFAGKKALFGENVVRTQGDNIYQPFAEGGFLQHRSDHSNPDGTEHMGLKKWDLSGKNVLIAKSFAYFGIEAPDLPPDLVELVVGKGHRRFKPIHPSYNRLRESLLKLLGDNPRGVMASPKSWPKDDTSWEVSGSVQPA